MYKKLKRISEVFLVMEKNENNNWTDVVFVETSREEAEKDIENYCKDPNTTNWIQIEKIYTKPGEKIWLEEFD